MTWTNRPDTVLFEQTRAGANGHAVTLLWAEDHDADEPDLDELGVPSF